MRLATQQTIRFTGSVQGVGFRATTVRMAEGQGVDGTVRNAADGSVELVVSGDPAKIGELVDRLTDRFDAHAESTTTTPGQPPATPTAGAGIRVVR